MEGLNTKSSEFMGTEPVTRLIMKFAVPSILGMLSHSLYNIVDRAFVGRYVGSEGLAAISVCFPYMLSGFALAMLPGAGGGALISIALGERDIGKAERVLGNSLFVAFVVAFVMTVPGIFFPNDVIRLSGGVAGIEKISREYLDIIVWGMPFFTFDFVMSAHIRAQGHPRYAMLVLVFGAVCNIALDALFIVGFGWGIKGAAFATILSQFLVIVWILRFFLLKKGELRIKFANLRPRISILNKIFMLGLSPASTEMSFSLFMLLFNRAIAEHGGAVAMSAFGIFMGWDSLLFFPVLGIAEAVQPIFGYNWGARLLSRVEEALKSAIILACGYFLTSMVVVYFFARQMIAIFTSEPLLTEIAVRGMKISYAAVIFVGITVITSSYLQGLGKAKLSLLLSFAKHVLFLIPTILIMPRFFGLVGVWGSFPVVDICGGFLSVAMLLYLKKWGRVNNE